MHGPTIDYNLNMSDTGTLRFRVYASLCTRSFFLFGLLHSIEHLGVCSFTSCDNTKVLTEGPTETEVKR